MPVPRHPGCHCRPLARQARSEASSQRFREGQGRRPPQPGSSRPRRKRHREEMVSALPIGYARQREVNLVSLRGEVQFC